MLLSTFIVLLRCLDCLIEIKSLISLLNGVDFFCKIEQCLNFVRYTFLSLFAEIFGNTVYYLKLSLEAPSG